MGSAFVDFLLEKDYVRDPDNRRIRVSLGRSSCTTLSLDLGLNEYTANQQKQPSAPCTLPEAQS